MMRARECKRPQQGGVVLRWCHSTNMQESKAAFLMRDSPDIGGQSPVINVNDLVAGGEWSGKQIGPRALADSNDPITPARSKRKFQLATQLIRRLNQTMSRDDDRLHSGGTGGNRGDDSRRGIMAMHYVGRSAAKGP